MHSVSICNVFNYNFQLQGTREYVHGVNVYIYIYTVTHATDHDANVSYTSIRLCARARVQLVLANVFRCTCAEASKKKECEQEY
jgi:hypothetical protein